MKSELRRKAYVSSKLGKYEKIIPDFDKYIDKEFEVGNDGYANIDLVEYDGMEWFDPMSSGNQRELNGDVYDFLDKKSFYIPVDYPVRVRIKNSRLSEDDKDFVKNIMREHYTLGLWEETENLKHNRLAAIGLALFGAMLLITAFAAASAGINSVISEMMMIVATFTFWEAADYAMLKRGEILKQKIYAGQMATADLVFE
jgi:hypothetical protein